MGSADGGADSPAFKHMHVAKQAGESGSDKAAGLQKHDIPQDACKCRERQMLTVYHDCVPAPQVWATSEDGDI